MLNRHSLDPKDFDASVKPTDDFFGFVNGKWIERNPIPPEESRWGSFDVLRREAEEQLKEILDEVSTMKDALRGTDEQKIRDFYLTAMDVEKRNSLGVAPLADIFKMIDEATDGVALARTVGRLQRYGISVFWDPIVEQDEKRSEMMALHLYQGGLSLPDRDYYLNEDEKSRGIRERYLKYVEELSGSMDPGLRRDDTREVGARKTSETILAIETRLAAHSRTRVELRDVEKQYNKMTAAELVALTPNIAWKEYFAGATVAMPDYVIVGQPEFFAELDGVFADTPLDVLRQYLRWHALNCMAAVLSEDLEKLRFDFYSRTFRGEVEMKARWRRALGVMNALLDEMLGKLYVKRHFSEDAKQKVNLLVDRLVAAYRIRIMALDWMGEETKKKALEKLGAFSRKLGYPDVWKDFSSLEVATVSYADNYLRACTFDFDRNMRKIGKPVDRDEWLMPPQMVNAYYQPPLNEIAFPAAILQPPFFDPAADDALNFGGIGSFIGHELTHGFDDQGSLFDLHGNLKNWWTLEDKRRFDEKAGRLAAQFDAYEPIPGVHVNGKLTLGENIADLGGLLIAYDAFRIALAEKPATERLDGFTPEQRFFLNFAATERGSVREELMRMYLQTDPHSPSKCRVNGPSSNLEEFYRTFGCGPDDKLWREPGDRVRIW